MPVFEEWRVAGLCSRRVRVRVWRVAPPRPAHLDSDNFDRSDTSRTRKGFINATAANYTPIAERYRVSLYMYCILQQRYHTSISVKRAHLKTVLKEWLALMASPCYRSKREESRPPRSSRLNCTP